VSLDRPAIEVVEPPPHRIENTLAACRSARWPVFQQLGFVLGHLRYWPTVVALDW
jgi:hypothetical protein